MVGQKEGRREDHTGKVRFGTSRENLMVLSEDPLELWSEGGVSERSSVLGRYGRIKNEVTQVDEETRHSRGWNKGWGRKVKLVRFDKWSKIQVGDSMGEVDSVGMVDG